MTDDNDENTDQPRLLETWDAIAAYLSEQHNIGRSTRRVRDLVHRDPPLPVTYPSWASGRRAVARTDELDQWAAYEHQRAQEHRAEQRRRRKALQRARARMRRQRTQKSSVNVRTRHSHPSARSRTLDCTSAASATNGDAIMLKIRHTGTRRAWDADAQTWTEKPHKGPIVLPDLDGKTPPKLGPGDVQEFPARYLHTLEENRTTKLWLEDGRLELVEFEDDDEDEGADPAHVAATAGDAG